MPDDALTRRDSSRLDAILGLVLGLRLDLVYSARLSLSLSLSRLVVPRGNASLGQLKLRLEPKAQLPLSTQTRTRIQSGDRGQASIVLLFLLDSVEPVFFQRVLSGGGQRRAKHGRDWRCA